MASGNRAMPMLLAIAPALILVAMVDAARVPGVVYGHEPGLAAQVFGQAILSASPHLLLPLAFQVVAILVVALPGGLWPRGYGRYAALSGASLLFCASNYASMVVLDRLPFSWLSVAGYIPVAVFLSVGLATLPQQRQSRWPRLAWAVPATGAIGFIAVAWINDRALAVGYPAFHLAMLQISYVLLHIAFAHVIARARPTRVRRIGVAVVASFAAIAALWGGASGAATPCFRHYTFLGQADLASNPFGADPDPGGPAPGEDADAEVRFGRSHGFPPLPPGFDVTRYNVLLITTEALAMRHTSLAQHDELDNTPRLRGWSRDHALIFTRAHSPSSNTLQSFASLFTMTYPAAVHLTTLDRRWRGRVEDENLTVAELFAASGYRTFWAGGNVKRLFTKDGGISGLDQGFSQRSLVARDDTSTDETVAEVASSFIEAHKDARFFGWVHFVGPHSPYNAYSRDRPAESRLDRYRQELRNADEQMGRVLDTLDRLDLTQRTIVIVTGDHGEEFGEHRGRNHGATVYEEVVHVPLVIAIPGVAGRRISATTSTLYTFPWLLLRGNELMRGAARARLTKEIGPMLRDTAGAVVVELLGHDRMRSALIYAGRKFHYDYFSKLVQVYDLANDPRERDELYQTDASVRREAEARLLAYRRLRYRIRNVVVGR